MFALADTGFSAHCPPACAASPMATCGIALSGSYRHSMQDLGLNSVSALGRMRVSRSVLTGSAWVE
jgi:hypothetical protein